ncbi:Rv3654c family TadE-like protein [Streptomyces sp. NPDC026659]|uniref:Rv3654c family TadE-like protein n=1 Tax=Streptomyces sp. NPDC026659 TaxID=3155123 RepID=UPI0033DD7670
MRYRDSTARRGRGDQGSATVWSLGAVAVLCVVFGAVLALGHAVAVRHRAAGAADLAALAAADHWAEGGAAACARAERVATAQGARLVRCVISGEVSDVSAGVGRGPFTAEVRSRAGPAGPAGPPGPVSPAGTAGPVSDPEAPASPPLHSPTRSPPG